MWLGANRMDERTSQALVAGLNRPLSSLERALEAISVLSVLLSFALPLAAWGRLPDQVPTHFGASGQADAFGPRSALLNLAWVQVGMWLFMSLLLPLMRRISPRYWNVPVRVTEDNAERVAGALGTSLRWLKLLTLWTFTLVQLQMVNAALVGSNALSVWFLPLILILPILSIVIIGLSFASSVRADRSPA